MKLFMEDRNLYRIVRISRRSHGEGRSLTEEFWEPHLEKFLHLIVSPIYNEAKQLIGTIHILKDLTEHKQTQEKILRANRLYAVLSKINETVIRVRNKQELFQQACQIAVETGLLRMAWIGLVDLATSSVKPVAHYGHEDGYLDMIKISIDPQLPEGRGPTGTALREKKYLINNDTRNNPQMLPWREEAIKRGYYSSAAFPLLSDQDVLGILTLYANEAHFFSQEEINLLSSLSEDIAFAAVALENEQKRRFAERQMAEERQRNIEGLQNALKATIQALATTAETRDPYTAGHQRRVANLACAIAAEMGLSADQIEGLRMASSIHDIGKISIPAEILARPNKLSNIEFGLIKTHAQAGYDILKDLEFPWPIARIVLEHHERLDGSGYPRGATGEKILLESKILAVADVAEAMASHRPYRPALGIDVALQEIEKNKGSIYDATAADACLRIFKKKRFTNCQNLIVNDQNIGSFPEL